MPDELCPYTVAFRAVCSIHAVKHYEVDVEITIPDEKDPATIDEKWVRGELDKMWANGEINIENEGEVIDEIPFGCDDKIEKIISFTVNPPEKIPLYSNPRQLDIEDLLGYPNV